MALIAGAFLWLTFEEQALYGAPLAGAAMWFGFFVALLLCLATAISCATTVQAVSGNRLVVLLRRAGVPEGQGKVQGMPVS